MTSAGGSYFSEGFYWENLSCEAIHSRVLVLVLFGAQRAGRVVLFNSHGDTCLSLAGQCVCLMVEERGHRDICSSAITAASQSHDFVSGWNPDTLSSSRICVLSSTIVLVCIIMNDLDGNCFWGTPVTSLVICLRCKKKERLAYVAYCSVLPLFAICKK